jgi:hypothetical protein
MHLSYVLLIMRGCIVRISGNNTLDAAPLTFMNPRKRHATLFTTIDTYVRRSGYWSEPYRFRGPRKFRSIIPSGEGTPFGTQTFGASSGT